MIRPKIVKILLRKEFLRLKKNPSAITLLVLLAAIALLVSLSWTDPEPGDDEATCYVAYSTSWENEGWIDYLTRYQDTYPNLEVVPRAKLADPQGQILLDSNECAIEILPATGNRFSKQIEVVYHYPENRESMIAKPASWFWASWKQFGTSRVDYEVSYQPFATKSGTGLATTIRDSAANKLDLGLISTMLLLAVQFFTCCHLYVSFGSQDRERGTLGAIAMSPASTTEIIFSRAIFHQFLGLTVSAIILVIMNRAALLQHHVWLTLIAVGFGWLSVGTIITTITKSQSQASMLMFCYMLVGGILFFMASQFPIFAVLQNLTFENHAVNLLHTGLEKGYALFLPAAVFGILVLLWASLALRLFQQRGWQS